MCPTAFPTKAMFVVRGAKETPEAQFLGEILINFLSLASLSHPKVVTNPILGTNKVTGGMNLSQTCCFAEILIAK